MKRTPRVLLLPTALCLPLALGTACSQPAPTTPPTPPPTTATAVQEVNGHVMPTMEGVTDVMLAKLAHTQAIIEGITRSDYDQIRMNAVDLTEISRKTEWMVSDTVTYSVLSDAFRNSAQALANDAAAARMEAVKEDFFAMTETCIDCHTYLGRERRFKDMPGEMSRRNGGLPTRQARGPVEGSGS